MGPILFCKIAWMEEYRGLRGGKDIPIGGGEYIKIHKTGIEIYNFQPYNGHVYGIVGFGKSNIERLGAEPEDEWINGVTVVWVAPRPKVGSVIVGWYRNATVYRDAQDAPKGARGGEEGYFYLMRARVEDSTLLPIDERTLSVPEGKRGFGQSQNWYADKSSNAAFRKKVLNYINNWKPTSKRRRVVPKGVYRQVDSAKRTQVEKAAVAAAWDYFENLGYAIKDVQKDNTGYDLLATKGHVELYVEVKGLSGREVIIELTPNEYEWVQDEDTNYRICVVTEALKGKRLRIFSYSGESGCWKDEGGDRLEFEEKKAARAYITQL